MLSTSGDALTPNKTLSLRTTSSCSYSKQNPLSINNFLLLLLQTKPSLYKQLPPALAPNKTLSLQTTSFSSYSKQNPLSTNNFLLFHRVARWYPAGRNRVGTQMYLPTYLPDTHTRYRYPPFSFNLNPKP
jgi:hypothetical protein